MIRDLIIGLLTIALLLSVKCFVEDSNYGKWFNARGYEILHSFIPNYNSREDIPVIILDISDIERIEGKIPLSKLEELINALADSGAKAVAIDADFSPQKDDLHPENNGPKYPHIEEFFDKLHKIKNDRGIEVFLGTYENIGTTPDSWLGDDEYQDLAADMTISFSAGDPTRSTGAILQDTTEIPAWLQCDPDVKNPKTKLRSISRALADAYNSPPRPDRPVSPKWLQGFLANSEDTQNLIPVTIEDNAGNFVPCKRALTLVNYSKLELVQRLIWQSLDKNSIHLAKTWQGANRFQDKMVIIGSAQYQATTDKFHILGRDEGDTIPGIYLHAMAAYTLAADPVYKLKYWASLGLDSLLAAFIVFGVFTVRFVKRKKKMFSQRTWENRFVLISVVLTIILGYSMVRFYHILWLDFLLVIFALFLHSKIRSGLVYIPQRLFHKVSQYSEK